MNDDKPKDVEPETILVKASPNVETPPLTSGIAGTHDWNPMEGPPGFHKCLNCGKTVAHDSEAFTGIRRADLHDTTCEKSGSPLLTLPSTSGPNDAGTF